MSDLPKLHLLVSTHTTRHLAGLLAGLSRQTDAPETITISCDTDDAEIGELIAHWAQHVPKSHLRWVRREYTGRARPAQARNNGIRALEAAGEVSDDDYILQLDGDMVLTDTAVAEHRRLALEGYEEVIGERVTLTEEETVAFDAERYRVGELQHTPSNEEMERLAAVRLKKLGHLKKRNKLFARKWKARPNLIGAHVGYSMRAFRLINGYDEDFDGWGREDDDIARRFNSIRPRLKLSIVVDTILGLHLWHPTRVPDNLKGSASYQRFKRMDLPHYPEHGLTSPLEQPEPICTLYD